MREHKLKDHLDQILVALDLFSLVFHAWQFYASGYNPEPLVRIAAGLIFIPIALIYHERGYRVFFTIYANLLIYLYDFTNYTPILILVLATEGSCIQHKAGTFSIFLINLVLSLTLQHKAPSHLAIYITNAVAFYLVATAWRSRTKQPLQLTQDEIKILNQLAEGKLQKEIPEYNKNTVTRKLHEAAKRNHASSTGELLARFKEEQSQ